MGFPVVEVFSGGIPATEVANGPVCIVGASGLPITWVASGGIPLSKGGGASGMGIAQDWRLPITGPVIDSTGDAATAAAIGASSTARTFPGYSTTRTVTVPVAETGPNGGIIVLYGAGTVGTFEESFNGTDWSGLTVRQSAVTNGQRTSFATIPVGGARSVRYTGIAVGIGFFNMPTSGIPDMWLQVGASHTAEGARPRDMHAAVRAQWPDYDPVFINAAQSAAASNVVSSNALAAAALFPECRLCLAETGGNDVSAGRPYSTYTGNLDTVARAMVSGLQTAGLTVFLENISYREYVSLPPVNNGANPENGSLPFNTGIMHGVIEDLTPACWDATLATARIDNYSLLFANRSLLDPDGVHPSTLSGYPLQRAFWADTAVRFAYTGAWPRAYSVQVVETLESTLTYTAYYNAFVVTRDLPASAARTALIARVETPAVKDPAILDGATIAVGQAEVLLTQPAKDEAQAFVDLVNGTTYASEKAALQARLDAIVISSDKVAIISLGTNTVAPPAQRTGSVSTTGTKIANIKDTPGDNTGWSFVVVTQFGFTASSGGAQPSPNTSGFALDVLLGYGSYNSGSSPTFDIRGLDPAKTYDIKHVLSRAAGIGRQTITINGVAVSATAGASSLHVLDHTALVPVDLGGGVFGLRIALSTLDTNSAYAGLQITEHN